MDVPKTPNGLVVHDHASLIMFTLVVGALVDLLIAASLVYYLRKIFAQLTSARFVIIPLGHLWNVNLKQTPRTEHQWLLTVLYDGHYVCFFFSTNNGFRWHSKFRNGPDYQVSVVDISLRHMLMPIISSLTSIAILICVSLLNSTGQSRWLISGKFKAMSNSAFQLWICCCLHC